jgi:hypothetical protein
MLTRTVNGNYTIAASLSLRFGFREATEQNVKNDAFVSATLWQNGLVNKDRLSRERRSWNMSRIRDKVAVR